MFMVQMEASDFMSSPDFLSSATMRSTFWVFSEMSRQMLNGLDADIHVYPKMNFSNFGDLVKIYICPIWR